MNNTMKKLNEMDLSNVCGGTDYDFEVPVIGLDGDSTGCITEPFGGDEPGTGTVTIITKEERDEAVCNYSMHVGYNLVQRNCVQPPIQYYLNEVLKKHGKNPISF